MKIGILGGTFSPIHDGHLRLAKTYQQELGLEKMLLIPTYQPPHKESRELAGAEHRLEMCRLACKEDPRYKVCDLEIRRGGKSYTADTLRELSRLYPENRWVLLMGEDMFLTMQTWREPEKIWQMADICAAPRSSEGMPRLAAYAQELEKQGGRTVLEDVEYLPVSSTMVRGAVKRRESIGGLVPAAVAEYIHQHHLYEGR